MQNNKALILFFLLVLTTASCFSQVDSITSPQTRTRKYAFFLYLSGGGGYFLSGRGAPAYLQPQIARVNPVYTARIMWKPDHRLKAGFETGQMTFYSYKLTDENGNKGTVKFNGIPLLLEFSVALNKRWNLFAGPGAYILNTELDYQGKSKSQKVTMGWMAALAYVQPITKELGLGAEAKWLYASETVRGSIALQAQLVWRFFRW